MASDIFKSIVLGLVSFGGIGTAIYFGINTISTNNDLSKTIEIISDESNIKKQDLQYQFLYKLAKKVFNHLKKQNPTSKEKKTKAVVQENLISWLIAEFKQATHSTEDNWQNFKSLCEAQKPKENKIPTESDGEDNIKVPASRVCYLDKGLIYTGSGNYEKGYLGLWETEEPGYLGFGLWTWSNLQLWDYFNHHYLNQSPIDKFDEWYDKQTEDNGTNKITTIKNKLKQS